MRCLFLLATFWRVSAAGDLVQGWRLLAVTGECRARLWQVEQARQRVRVVKWLGTETARQMEGTHDTMADSGPRAVLASREARNNNREE